MPFESLTLLSKLLAFKSTTPEFLLYKALASYTKAKAMARKTFMMAMSSTYFSHTGCFQDKYINETDEILRMILLKTKGENNSDKA